MAAFKQDFSITQSGDCKTLTFTDTSNFDSNDEGYNYAYFTTKKIQVFDSLNTQIGSDILITGATPVTFTLDKDRWLSIVYTLQHNTDGPLTKTYDVALSCFVDLSLGTLVAAEDFKKNDDKEVNSAIFNIVKTTLASKIYAKRNNPILSQEMLDAANEYASCGLDYNNSNCNC